MQRVGRLPKIRSHLAKMLLAVTITDLSAGKKTYLLVLPAGSVTKYKIPNLWNL